MPEQLPLTRALLQDAAAGTVVCMAVEPISETAEVELWNALMRTVPEYAQSLADLDALVLDDTDSSQESLNRGRIEEAAAVRQSAFIRYRQARDQLTAYDSKSRGIAARDLAMPVSADCSATGLVADPVLVTRRLATTAPRLALVTTQPRRPERGSIRRSDPAPEAGGYSLPEAGSDPVAPVEPRAESSDSGNRFGPQAGPCAPPARR
jgi:hypothetical protein